SSNERRCPVVASSRQVEMKATLSALAPLLFCALAPACDTGPATADAAGRAGGRGGDGSGGKLGTDQSGGLGGDGSGGQVTGGTGTGGKGSGGSGGIPANCGDGHVDDGEACDDGEEAADCNTNCTEAACGDGSGTRQPAR